MHSDTDITPLDYVLDSNGWIHIIRILINEDLFVTKPIYYTKGATTKCKTTIAGFPPPCGTPFLTDSRFDYVLQKELIVSTFPRSIIDSHTTPKEINAVLDSILPNSKIIYLFGSRTVGLHKEHSDWDILIDTPGYPPDIIDHIVKSTTAKRMCSSNNIDKRLNTYLSADSPFASPKTTLNLIFSKTTIYIELPNVGELGVFFLNSHHSVRFYKELSLPLTARANPRTISGKILLSGGSSFYMPRIFKIQSSQGTITTLHSSIWELAGIEMLHGKTVVIDSFIPLQEDNNYFLIGSPSSINFE